jgi:hypothetical protein
MNEISPFWLSLGQFVLNVIVLGGVGIWRMAKMEVEVTQKIEEGLDKFKSESKRDLEALREKHTSTERWMLEEFVRREDMKATIDQLNVTLGTLGDRFEIRMARIEDKIDKLR